MRRCTNSGEPALRSGIRTRRCAVCGARDRRGSVLVFAAILSFVVFALAGLVVDLGLAWVTQSRMTSAADSAALEGLRWRDQFPDTVSDPNAYVIAGGGDPSSATDMAAARDRARRAAAAGLASIQFAGASLTQPGSERFGAGPLFIHQSGTIGPPELNAGETLLPGSPTVYKPQLQSNAAGNLDSGDIVAGSYNSDVTVSHREGATAPGSNQFTRQDFAVSAPADAPGSSSLLVRMRHSHDPAVAGAASTGPAIPYLFSRGAFLPGYASANGYAPRRDGITVRATAIANAAPVVYAGSAIDSAGVAGVGLVALTRDFWENALPPMDDSGQPAAVRVSVTGTSLNGTNGPVGILLAAIVQSIGAVPVAGNPTLPPTFSGYVPIYDVDPEGAIRVIGFGWAEVDISGETGSVTKLSKAGGAIAPRNASADLRFAWPTLGPPALSNTDRAYVRGANARFKDPLLAPVLVRSTAN